MCLKRERERGGGGGGEKEIVYLKNRNFKYLLKNTIFVIKKLFFKISE
jgi:hypothetical protein